MGTRPYGKYALVPVFLACSAFGAWATIGHCLTHGLSDAIGAVLDGERPALAGAPAPFKLRYVGLGPVDRMLGTAVAFFSALLDGDVPPEDALAAAWCLAQFGAGWALLLLESLRAGNRARALGGPAALVVFGLFVQTCTWTFALPLYLVLHLFTSPVASPLPSLSSPPSSSSPAPGPGATARGPVARRRLFAFLWDLALLPTSVTLSFVLPAVLMAMPAFLGMSSAAHYKIMALWQLFPLLNVVVHSALHALGGAALGPLRPTDSRGRPAPLGAAYLSAVAGVYQFALALCVLVHVPVLALTLAPAPARAWLVAVQPTTTTGLVFGLLPADVFVARGLPFARVFLPASPWAAPAVVDPKHYASGDLAPLAAHFLRCDLLVASVPFLLWALYLHQTTVRRPSLGRAALRVAFWLLVGGVTAPVVALLWDRDAVVLEDDLPPPARIEKKKTR